MIEQIFVINLAKDIERRKNIEQNLTKYNLKYQIFPAVYGKELPNDVLQQNTTAMCRTLLCNKSIIGSGMSHVKIWRHIAQQPSGWYMVCEDDINFTDKSLQHLGEIFKKVGSRKREPILINLNSCNAYHYHADKTLLQESKLICGIAAYIITPSAASRLVAYIDKAKINNYIDIQVSFCNCDIKYYTTPFPIVIDSTYGGYKTSNNMSYAYSVPLAQFVVDLVLPSGWSSIINFRLNLMAFCILMTYCVSIGQLVLLLVALSNVFLKSQVVWIYLLLELLVFILFRITK